ncbi:hypothetical protein [Actinomadura macrotermitis]|uniref:Uncharacterized protein n=1 Tax=Actinomadura macrotermitis TaxID=2585200 RepID=A0A7K0BRS6_9ACTN|nr:hypothetical protein [Actinomadura macrotermitis]MQY03900.1 hypothetical protein [Actinomadura macrotermitis]
MSRDLILLFADPVEPDEFLDLVEELGGVRRPDEWTGGRLSRGDDHVQVSVAPDGGFAPDDEYYALYELWLGAPMQAWALLALSTSAGSQALGLELIEAAARRWRTVVDDNHGELYTVDEWRALVTARP